MCWNILPQTLCLKSKNGNATCVQFSMHCCLIQTFNHNIQLPCPHSQKPPLCLGTSKSPHHLQPPHHLLVLLLHLKPHLVPSWTGRTCMLVRSTCPTPSMRTLSLGWMLGCMSRWEAPWCWYQRTEMERGDVVQYVAMLQYTMAD